MRLSNFLAIRYLKSSREDRFFSWITILSMLGISIGVAALVVVLSVINGFEFELRNRFLHANAHIMAYRYPAGMVNPTKWGNIITKDFPDDVKGTSPFIHYETMVKKGSIMHSILIRGIAPMQREKVQSIKDLISPPGALDQLQKELELLQEGQKLNGPPGLILGSGLMSVIDAKVGDTVNLVAPKENNFTDLRTFRIIGKYNSGLKHYDNRLGAMSLETAKDFFNMGNIVTGLEIGLHNADESVAITQKMQEKYNLTFREWQSFNKPLFDAMNVPSVSALATSVSSINRP